ncbi:TIR domain-containing protein [Arthrobacter zhaoxinii]|uniref:TIR domain-containing protein n=1 Tax=Arthrobacter zhaoxinii TaxID=2964616 RepID=UPI002105F0E9|nr:nucleotide-binding protein [Arthrobacter zhaoxinii]MCQ1999926.1 nucleotide-binding protein [Arthrobacter zhaoxinii]
MNNDEMFSASNAEQLRTNLGPSLVDAFAQFWAGGDGPKHTVIDRKIAAAGLMPTPDVSKERKIVDAFLAANDSQAYELMRGLLEALREFSNGPYSRGNLEDMDAGKRLRKTIQSAGYLLNDEFELADEPKESVAIASRQGERSRISPAVSAVHAHMAAKTEITSQEKAEILRVETDKTPPAEVFLVHGHDDMAVLEVSDWVHDLIGVKPTILRKQLNKGQTLIEKFESYSKNAACAIVLMTPDDEARAKREHTSEIEARARQNVVFELGYFYGKLRRENVIVVNFGVELPGDISGLVYIGKEDWKLDLGRELAGLGFSVHL